MKRLLLLLCLLHSPLLQAEITIVVPSHSPIQSLSKQQVSNLFLSKTNRLADGSKAVLIEIRNHQLRREFYRLISNKSANQLKSYWTTLIFTGKGKPPKSLPSREDVINFMKQNETTVTYLDSSEITTGMKVVYRFSSDN